MRVGIDDIDVATLGTLIIFRGFFAGHANDCAGAKIMVLPEARQVELPDRILRCVGQRDWRGGTAGGDSFGTKALQI